MNASTLVARGLAHHWRTHAGVLAGCAVSVAALVGALLVGDSMRHSLDRLVTARLGRTEWAMGPAERLFSPRLAERLSSELMLPAAAVLQTRGTAMTGGGQVRAHALQVLGVDGEFDGLCPRPAGFGALGPGEAVVNERLARHLGVGPGDELVLRLNRPGFLPLEAPLAPDSLIALTVRARVTAVAGDDRLARFSLRSNQRVPFNVFLNRAWLCAEAGLDDWANMILAAGAGGPGASEAAMADALSACWRLEDLGFEWRTLPSNAGIELVSQRVFLEPSFVEAALSADPGAVGVLSYFVSAIEMNGKGTPYSFVSAPGGALVPADMGDDEILVNDWLAEDLGADVGRELTLTYLVPGPGRGYEERTNTFRVRAVVPLSGPAGDPSLMPAFPGLADAGSCRDWSPGVPIDLGRIRDRDEQYWREHRGTPKAFVTLPAAQRMWGNRFGRLTAVRYPGKRAGEEAELAAAIESRIDPGRMGLFFRPVRADGLRAARGGVDFGQLFLGLSLFIIAAALLLTALLFAFGVEQRSREAGLLLALGFTRGRIRGLWLAEAAVPAVAGGLLGAAGGALYLRGMVWGLRTVWRDAVGVEALYARVEVSTLLVGTLVGVTAALLTVAVALSRTALRPLNSLLSENASAGIRYGRRRRSASVAVGLVLVAGALGLALAPGSRAGAGTAGVGLAAGALLLSGLIVLWHALLLRSGDGPRSDRMTWSRLAWLDGARKPGRSLATTALLACGVFMVVAVGANRHDPTQGAERRNSGTGGFALVGQSALPILHDLNTAAGRRFYGLSDDTLRGARFVSLRLHEEDDASCLNLNRVERPSLLGVDSGELDRRGSFRFAGLLPGADAGRPWTALERVGDPDEVPGIVDQTVMLWGLGKKLGDTLEYVDDTGRPFRVKLVGALANSIFQGHVLISERAFKERFGSTSGGRWLLVDAPPAEAPGLATHLAGALRDEGLEIDSAAGRLAEFGAVEGTYLAIFLALGGIGILIGSTGVGLVVLRNVLDRRADLALLRAVGFTAVNLKALLMVEHMRLLAAGVFIGVLAAVPAVMPTLAAQARSFPFATVLLLIVGLLLNGGVWVAVSVQAATHGRLLSSLRAE